MAMLVILKKVPSELFVTLTLVPLPPLATIEPWTGWATSTIGTDPTLVLVLLNTVYQYTLYLLVDNHHFPHFDLDYFNHLATPYQIQRFIPSPFAIFVISILK